MPIGPARPGRSLVSVAVLHPQEHFTPGERERLRPYFTDLDAPVFGLVNLPETVKAAMFARYSRYPGTLRRLFLDEFADSVAQPAPGGAPAAQAGRGPAGQGLEPIFGGDRDVAVGRPRGAPTPRA